MILFASVVFGCGSPGSPDDVSGDCGADVVAPDVRDVQFPGDDGFCDAVPVDVVPDEAIHVDSGIPDSPADEGDSFVGNPVCPLSTGVCIDTVWDGDVPGCVDLPSPDGTPCSGGYCLNGDCTSSCLDAGCPSWLSPAGGCFCRVMPTGSDFCIQESSCVACDGILPGDDWHGQDGHFQGLSRTMSDNEDGTVTDELTGLVWALEPSASIGIEAAEEYCNRAEGLPGDGWRVPAIHELFTLVDAGDGTCMWNSVFGPTCEGRPMFWSSTRAYASANFCTVHWGGNIEACERTSTLPVRCVRGEEGTVPADDDRFEVFDDVVFDRLTGLAWDNVFDEEVRSFKDALARCAAKGAGWRLPTTAELVSIMDPAREIDGCAKWSLLLGRVCSGDLYFWSSTPSPITCESPLAYAVHMASGHVHVYLVGRKFNVRCVRGPVQGEGSFEPLSPVHTPARGK